MSLARQAWSGASYFEVVARSSQGESIQPMSPSPACLQEMQDEGITLVGGLGF